MGLLKSMAAKMGPPKIEGTDGVGLRWDDPLLLEVRLESVFLSVRPIVLSLARSTMFSCTTALSSSVSVHRLRPFGGGEQASAISLASLAPSKMRFLAGWESAYGSGLHRGLPPARPPAGALQGDGDDAGVQRFGDLAVTPGFAGLRGIGLQQDACLQHLPCRTCALLYQRVEAFQAQVDLSAWDVSLYGRLFRDHDASPALPEP